MLRLFYYLLFLYSVLSANALYDAEQREFGKEQRRDNAFNDTKFSLLLPRQDTVNLKLILDEKPCFEIDEILLNSDKSKFQKYFKNGIEKLGFIPGYCLGENSINAVVDTINNELILQGYITSRFQIKPVNLKNKKLEFELILGKIDQIFINKNQDQLNSFTAFGGNMQNKALNLRNLEQALENISSVSDEVSMDLIASHKQNYTDIFIDKKSAHPFKFVASIDNDGSKDTGKYQGGLEVEFLNLFGLNEILSYSFSKNISRKSGVIRSKNPNQGKWESRYFDLTLPFGEFSLKFSHSFYTYTQKLFIANNIFDYSGKSLRDEVRLDYIFYRDDIFKNSFYFKLYKRDSKSYLDGINLDSQKRKAKGYELGFRQVVFLDGQILNFHILFKKATSNLSYFIDSKRAEILGFNADYKVKFYDFAYDFVFRSIWGLDRLDIQDRLNMGGKYSVRGFDGEFSLSADRGYYMRNTLRYNYAKSHNLYLGLDHGRALGEGGLFGASIGAEGEFRLAGKFGYDVLLGFSLKKPNNFKTQSPVLNFSINYTF